MAQPKFKKTMEQKIDKPEAIQVKCDVHGWMEGWLVATETPYFAVTDNSGSFKLTDVPPGNYTVEVWHEKLGKSTQKVTVKAKEDAKVNFEEPASKIFLFLLSTALISGCRAFFRSAVFCSLSGTYPRPHRCRNGRLPAARFLK